MMNSRTVIAELADCPMSTVARSLRLPWFGRNQRRTANSRRRRYLVSVCILRNEGSIIGRDRSDAPV